MLKVSSIVLALLITWALPATARIGATQPPSSSDSDQTLVGLPVVTADGETIGYITEVGSDDGHAVALAYVVRASGIGGVPITIPMKLLTNKGDHAELALTTEQLRAFDPEESGKIDADCSVFQ